MINILTVGMTILDSYLLSLPYMMVIRLHDKYIINTVLLLDLYGSLNDLISFVNLNAYHADLCFSCCQDGFFSLNLP